MGGDRAPEEVVAGALAAASDSIVPVLYGPADLETGGLEHVVTTQVIGMDEKPVEAYRVKPGSSLVAACRAVAEGNADAVVSAGNTGAMQAAGLFEIRRDVLVGHRRSLGTVPGAPIGIGVRIGCFRERAVRLAPLVGRGRPVHGRANQRMPEHHPGAKCHQAVRLDRSGSLRTRRP